MCVRVRACVRVRVHVRACARVPVRLRLCVRVHLCVCGRELGGVSVRVWVRGCV